MRRFLESNPGLKSRFNKHIHFEDYSSGELGGIFHEMLRAAEYTVTDEALEEVTQHLEHLHQARDEHFGNGRTVRNLFERIQQEQANRLSELAGIGREQLIAIKVEDVICAIREHRGEIRNCD